MRNVGLDEAQARIQIDRRNISHLRYADDTTLMSESEELKSHLMKVKEESEKELMSLLMKVKEEGEKGGLKFNIQKTKIMAYGPITLCK